MKTRRTYIREWRKAAKLSQEQLAERVGITQAYLSKIETGRAGYTQEILESVAEALRCTPGDLIMRSPESDPEIGIVWSSLSTDLRRKAIGILRLLKGDAA